MKLIPKSMPERAAAVSLKPADRTAVMVASRPQFSALLREQSQAAQRAGVPIEARSAAIVSPTPGGGSALTTGAAGESATKPTIKRSTVNDGSMPADARGPSPSAAKDGLGAVEARRKEPTARDSAPVLQRAGEVASGFVLVAPPLAGPVSLSTTTEVSQAGVAAPGTPSAQEPLQLSSGLALSVEGDLATSPAEAQRLGLPTGAKLAGCAAEGEAPGGFSRSGVPRDSRAAAASAVGVLEQAHNPVLQAVATALQRLPAWSSARAAGERRAPSAPVVGASIAPGATAKVPSAMQPTAAAVEPAQPLQQSFAACLVEQPTGGPVMQSGQPVRADVAGSKAPAGAASLAVDTSAKGSSSTATDATGTPLAVPQGMAAQAAVAPLPSSAPGSALMDARGMEAFAAAAPASTPVAAKMEVAGRAMTSPLNQERVSTPAASPDAALALGSVRLAQGVGQAEMQIGMHSPEFGAISIRTTSTQGRVSADVTVEHAELGKVMNDHLPEMQSRLAPDRPMDVRIHETATTGGGAGGSQAFGGGSRESGGGSARQQPMLSRGVARGSTRSSMIVPPMSNGSGSELRLDVRV